MTRTFGRSAVQLWLLAPVCEFEFFLPTAGTVVFHLTIANPLPACQENLTILSPDIRTQVIPHKAVSEVGGAVGIGAADPPGVVAFDVPPNSPPPLPNKLFHLFKGVLHSGVGLQHVGGSL